jgi:hypothetical protein
MFESITEAMLRHKQVVMAAIAITALAGYVVPLNQFAAAQDEDAFTTLEDIIAQEGTATASGEQNPTITAPNTQTNAIVTGPATATQTNTATSTSTASSSATGGSAEGGEGGDGCGDCDKKDGKKSSWSDGGSNDGDGGNAIGGDAFSAAQSGSSVSVNNNQNTADSSADNNDQSNTNTQTFDLDLDQTTTANVDQLAAQISDNYFNLDLGLDD